MSERESLFEFLSLASELRHPDRMAERSAERLLGLRRFEYLVREGFVHEPTPSRVSEGAATSRSPGDRIATGYPASSLTREQENGRG